MMDKYLIPDWYLMSIRIASVLAASVACLASFAPASSQAQQAVLRREVTRQVVDSLRGRLRTYYVFPDSVAAIMRAITTKWEAGGFDSLTANGFASRLTGDLRTASRDSHLAVVFDPKFETRLRALRGRAGAIPADPPPTPDAVAADRRINNGFTRAEILDGNVGYLRLERWVDLKRSRASAVAGIAFVANSDAVIIDLRGNPGGYGNLRDFLASHFLAAGTPLLSERNSLTKQTTPMRAAGATLRLSQPLFLLVDRGSASGSEGFAFILQRRQRARVVGDTTAGGGTGNLGFPLGNGFIAYVSSKFLFDQATGRSYHIRGVQPDIPATSERALAVAHHQAIEQLMSRADSSSVRRYQWLLPWSKARASEPEAPADSQLRLFAGKYERVEINVVDGAALGFLGAEGVVRRLRPLERNLFVLEDPRFRELDRIRVRFVFAGDRVSALELLTPDGNVHRRARL